MSQHREQPNMGIEIHPDKHGLLLGEVETVGAEAHHGKLVTTAIASTKENEDFPVSTIARNFMLN